MTRLQANTFTVGPIKNIDPQKIWGPTFRQTSGFLLNITAEHSMAVFVDERFGEEYGKDLEKFFDEPRIFAHCLCKTLGLDWIIESEPLEAGKVGFVIYTTHRKAIAAGTGTIDNRGEFETTIATLYDGITNRCRTKFSVHAKYSSADGEWGVAGQVEGEF
ncbi:hypothetical protein [Burkholderia stagnalis]|uniref:hypothetical protein n=1 Tax=Burkholderia stagnalis TaxID=1503054 RepID=UPI0012D883E1|nr:hypothetical protein [Burkholderia stagnalis]